MKLRTERLKEMIREETAELILHGISDPRLGFCTVTKVDLTNDLAYCKIHVSVLGDEGVKSRTMAALKDARGLIQVHVAKRMKTRTTPHVTVELDESIEKQFAIMDKIREARASDSDGGKGEENRGDAEDAEKEKDE
ncbi:MAG TPA: 30S ribosome-binding factor RbfA [Planctomycetota bacterium]|nr:30S ribosome-binding factor RbfA [Planctomycetota bacterium]